MTNRAAFQSLSRKFGADIAPRVKSAAPMALIAIAAMWIGGYAFAALTALACGAMAWEWRRIAMGPTGAQATPAILAVAAAAMLTVNGGVWLGWAAVALGAAATVAMDRGRGAPWTLAGVLYIGAAAICFVWLREQPRFGFMEALWMALVVIAADVGGYFAGRMIGGPKIAPRLSPKKTWSGTVGGWALAAAVSGVFSALTTGTYAAQVCVVGVIVAFVSQIGDLAESAYKRRFGVKDASALIPGHGGVLDRLDGFIAASLAVALITALRGKEVFVW